MTVTAALTQVLDGTTLVPNPECGACRRAIHAGLRVTVYAYRRVSEAWWQDLTLQLEIDPPNDYNGRRSTRGYG